MSIELLEQTTPIVLPWVGPLLLCPSEVRRVPTGIPGIYMLHAFAPSWGGYAVFYVGKASDLRRRLLQHLGGHTAKPSVRAARELDSARWSAAPVLDAGLLARVEAGLVLTLRPVCNAQVPGAEPVLVDLPPLSFQAAVI
jgi:hypothetical protein